MSARTEEVKLKTNSLIAPYVTEAMSVETNNREKVFWGFDSIIATLFYCCATNMAVSSLECNQIIVVQH